MCLKNGIIPQIGSWKLECKVSNPESLFSSSRRSASPAWRRMTSIHSCTISWRDSSARPSPRRSDSMSFHLFWNCWIVKRCRWRRLSTWWQGFALTWSPIPTIRSWPLWRTAWIRYAKRIHRPCTGRTFFRSWSLRSTTWRMCWMWAGSACPGWSIEVPS